MEQSRYIPSLLGRAGEGLSFILIVMEDTLGGKACSNPSEENLVLILIVMEDTLGEEPKVDDEVILGCQS